MSNDINASVQDICPAVPFRDDSSMKYWTLFTVRLLARVGLTASVCMWAMGQYQVDPSRRYVPFVMNSSLFVDAGGVGAVWPVGLQHWSSVSVDHWLLCLTFLITTVATSARWQRKPKETAIKVGDA